MQTEWEKFVSYLDSNNVSYEFKRKTYKDGAKLTYIIFDKNKKPVYEVDFDEKSGHSTCFCID